MDKLRSHFLLDPTVTFLNHGSFGATPREVLEVYHDWQRRLESQPVKFLGRELPDLLRSARRALGRFLQADPDNLVFIPNATFGVNVIARTFNFQPGDELLTSDQEYGACDNVWRYIGQRSRLKMVQREIPLPLPSDDEIVEIIWSGVTKQTRLIFLSHITSPTAVRLPVEQICQRARKAGILTLIDGAHAPGQIELNLTDFGADFYTGNCHKWLMAPKGSAFLHIRPEHQDTIQPLVVSWGWGENCPYPSDSHLQAVLEWWGTKDPAAYLSVPEAIQFQTAHHWDAVREKCRKLLEETLEKIQKITGLPSLYGTEKNRFCQVGAAFLPSDNKPDTLQAWLYDKHRIEIPVIHWRDQWLIRPSVQGYNTEEDLEMLVEALNEYLVKGS